MDENFCLFIIFTVLTMTIKFVLTVFVGLFYSNVWYADVLHSKDVIFVVKMGVRIILFLRKPTTVVIVGVSQTFC